MIREATWEDAMHVCKNMRVEDFKEVMATRWDDDVHSFASECMRTPGYKMVGIVDGRPVAIGGLAVWQPGIGQAWLVGTPEIGLMGKEIAKYCRKEIKRLFESGRCHRIQAFSSVEHEQAHQWLKLIGLKQESVMKKYGKNGEDFMTFSVLKEEI